jgi:LPS-assembly protein
MRYRPIILSSFFILFFVYHPHFIDAKEDDLKRKMTKQEGPVEIEADHLIYERDSQLYQAHGQVEVYRGNFSLKADHAQLNMATKELNAWGNVLLREGEDVIECERLEVNLNNQLGKITKAKLFLKDQNFHIQGREVEKLGENHYRIRDGSFTTCDAKRPPWKFTVKEMEVREMALGGFGIAKGPIAYFEGIPVLYLPVGVFPVRLERQTGFLFPRGGYSKKYGPEIKNAFFWAFAKNMDATFYFDWLGRRGFKEGLEYRYALTKETKGEAKFYFIDDGVFEKNRYAFFVQHEQRLPYHLYLKGDINRVSDHDYLRDFDEDLPAGAKIDSRSRRQLRSDLFGGKNWDQFSLLAQSALYDDLTQTSNDETVQKLPQVYFYAHPQSLFKTPFFYDVHSSYTNFWRERSVKAHRGDLLPRISYPVRLFNVLKLESDVALRETFYRSYDDPTNRFQGWKSRETLEAAAEMSTEFYRVYDGTMASKISDLYKVAKWMHTIEPRLSYTYVPRVDQSRLPAFDEVDQIPYTNQITYGVTQRLVGRPQKEGITSGPYEYGKLIISQSYSLGNPFERDEKGKERYFSNIQAALWWNFSPYVSAQSNAEFSPYRRNFNVLNALITAKDRRNDVVQVQYRYTKDNIQEANLDTRIKVIPGLYLFGSIRYNLLEHWRVENVYGAEYQAQCWTLGLSVEDRNRSPDGTQSKELKFQLYFNLLGIGTVGRKPYYMSL